VGRGQQRDHPRRCPTLPEAIQAGVELASRTASHGRRVQVLVDEPVKGRTVI